MKFSEAETLINARSSTVWEVLTDTGNFTVWESGITAIDGEIRDGGTIRIRTGPGRGLRLRVHQLPGELLRWQAALPLGLLRRAFTVVLTPQPGRTRLRITHELSGALSPFAGTAFPASEEALHSFVRAVRERAELLERHS